jgi:hypothetical protein
VIICQKNISDAGDRVCVLYQTNRTFIPSSNYNNHKWLPSSNDSNDSDDLGERNWQKDSRYILFVLSNNGG